MTAKGLIFGLILTGITAMPVQAQSTDILKMETAIAVNGTNYACIPEAVYWQQALPPGVTGSGAPYQNPHEYQSIQGAPNRAYTDL